MDERQQLRLSSLAARSLLAMAPLLSAITAEIRASGPLTFARYMELCLYHPEFGYYRSGRGKLGPAGDFYTSAHVHAAFARLLVARWVQMWEELGRGDFLLLEPGAGGGEIGREAVSWAARAHPEFARSLDYVPLEYGHSLPERVAGCIFSNEFFDAQPVHVVRYRNGALEELYVGERDGGGSQAVTPPAPPPIRAPAGGPTTGPLPVLGWTPGPLSSPELASWLSRLRIEPEEGQWLEVSLAAARWMRRFARVLERGYVLSVDYGYRAREVNAGGRFPGGSLMTYRRHTASAEVFREPGDRDITAHVNFDLLRAAGEEEGLAETFFSSQGAYLARLGEPSQFAEVFAHCAGEADRLRASLLLKNLLFGIGETMQVQEMKKV